MRLSFLCSILACAVLLVGHAVSAAAQSFPAFTADTGIQLFTSLDRTLGWSFVAGQDLTVTDLGFYDQTSSPGLAVDHVVGIWTDAGALLTSAIVPMGTTATLEGNYRFVSVAPVGLVTGETYIVGGTYTGQSDDPTLRLVDGINFAIPAISFLEGRLSGPGTSPTLTFPAGTTSEPVSIYMNANFKVMRAPVIVEIDWVTVGDPGNACDAQAEGCFGSVAEPYRISKFEVTNAQYAAFLNAVAANDTNVLYNASMGSGVGGITQSGSPGSFVYSAIPGRENMPVNYVSFWDATRFANWLHNGQPTGAQDDTTTEDGAYTLTPTGISTNTVTRNAGAEVFVTSEDEWYKAAYYDTGAMIYFDFPASSDTQTVCTVPGAIANTANCFPAVLDLTDGGSYTNAAGPNGTFDQGGNVSEWNEAVINGLLRGMRGGGFNSTPLSLGASFQNATGPNSEVSSRGFRVASPVPAPPVPLLSPFGVAMLSGMLGLAGWRRLRG